jgi:hypothetical protein
MKPNVRILTALAKPLVTNFEHMNLGTVTMATKTTISIPEKFETFSEAKKRRDSKIGILRKGEKPAQKLATKLDQCSKEQGCNSAACDVCVGRERLKLYRETQPIFAAHPDWTRASIIPAGFLVPVGKLSTVDLKAINTRINKRLERSSLQNRIVIAGIDISLNLQDNEIVGWQLHFYMLIEGKNTVRLQEAIKAAFPPEPTALIPHLFSSVIDTTKAITYLFKNIFHRRSRYTTSNSQARTKDLPLKGSDLRELLPFLDQFPIGVRLILRGIRRNGSRLIAIK